MTICLFLLLNVNYSYSTEYKNVILPFGLSFVLPQDFVIASKDNKPIKQLKAFKDYSIDLSNIDVKLEKKYSHKSSILFKANLFNEENKTACLINVVFYPNITDNEIINNMPIEDYDSEIQNSIYNNNMLMNNNHITWIGSKRVTIDNKTAFITKYHRQNISDNSHQFIVRIVRFFLKNGCIGITISYRHNNKSITDSNREKALENIINKKIADNIIKFIKIN